MSQGHDWQLTDRVTKLAGKERPVWVCTRCGSEANSKAMPFVDAEVQIPQTGGSMMDTQVFDMMTCEQTRIWQVKRVMES